MQTNLHLQHGARSQNKTASLVVGSSALLPLHAQGCCSFCPPYTGSVLLKGESILGIPRFRAMHWPLPVPRRASQCLGLSSGSRVRHGLSPVYLWPSLFLSWAPAALCHQPSSFPSRPLNGMFPALPSSPSLTPPPHLCDLTFTCPPHLRLDVTPLVNEVFTDLPNLGGVS